jgi:hypothetical protein
MLLKEVKWVPFGLGLLIGVIALHFVKTEPVKIMQYPHPDTVKQRVYRDKNGTCYKYTAMEVNCDENEKTLKPYPLQG